MRGGGGLIITMRGLGDTLKSGNLLVRSVAVPAAKSFRCWIMDRGHLKSAAGVKERGM